MSSDGSVLRRGFPFTAILSLLLLAPAGTFGGAQSPDYVVGPQDVLAITVWDQSDLNGKFAVETDGTFTFPLIGRVRAGGLSLREVELELKTRLADGYFTDPQVTVAVEQYRSQRIFVVGEVRTPGTYPLTGDMTLIEALSKAGSTTPSAGDLGLVVRARGGRQHGPLLPDETGEADVVKVDLKALQSGGIEQNVALRDGDTIFVPKAESVYVYGQVRSPGAYALQQSQTTTVLQALSLAGGATDRGAVNRVRIVRIVNGEKVELKVKLSDLVQPGDTLIVPERYI
jgi:polysaccharide biosynthesis/export protein